MPYELDDVIQPIWYCLDCISTELPYNHYDNDTEFMQAISESVTVKNTLVENLNNNVSEFTPFDDDYDDCIFLIMTLIYNISMR